MCPLWIDKIKSNLIKFIAKDTFTPMDPTILLSPRQEISPAAFPAKQNLTPPPPSPEIAKLLCFAVSAAQQLRNSRGEEGEEREEAPPLRPKHPPTPQDVTAQLFRFIYHNHSSKPLLTRMSNMKVLEAGLEPAISSLGGRRLIH